MVKLAVLRTTSSTRGDMKAFDCEFCGVMSAIKCTCSGLEIPPRPSGGQIFEKNNFFSLLFFN